MSLTNHKRHGAPRDIPDRLIPTGPGACIALWAEGDTIYLRQLPGTHLGCVLGKNTLPPPPRWGRIIRLPRGEIESLIHDSEPMGWEKIRRERPDELGVDDVMKLGQLGHTDPAPVSIEVVAGSATRWYFVQDGGRPRYVREDLVQALTEDSVR